ncbi:NADPH:adrenodoxin oxidoreductase, mitochondrial-like [Pomacea canaliculata]|uniref:NADPH:adrenodoxin oxidoreductase, mitochondrial-like n=1 Tax=Pomacea canaliculata TaxID=400727 RepID=UPI000D73E241|nr:NADPH:adrenodoxin oxidoreductase, mitochondrial-like [Pomacea canaliculata]
MKISSKKLWSLSSWTKIHHFIQCRKIVSSRGPSVAIVGSGPAGFYTAQHLLKGHSSLTVDIYEKLPVPFGLVRFGVAPDHPEVKNCINTFTQTAHNERCCFLGNVEVGKDLTVSDLTQAYTAVVLCYGASNDRQLGIPGEMLPNVLSARSFVGWYNGLPENKDLTVNLSCETAVVLGHGNVALDVARILLTPIDILKKTDITEHSLEMLSKSKVKKVLLVGRRGPLQAAFTIKELREMITLPGCRTVIYPEDVQGLDVVVKDLPRPRRRLTELLYTTAVQPPEKHRVAWANATREWILQFLRSPIAIKASTDAQCIESVHFVVNRYYRSGQGRSEVSVLKKYVLSLDSKVGDVQEKQIAVATDHTEDVLRSIGYTGIPIDDFVPFDTKRGVIQNSGGRVIGCKGLYCSGWISQGPVFVILGAMNDGFATGKAVLEDIASGVLPSGSAGGREAVMKILSQKGVRPVSFSDWEKINQAEIQLGKKNDKPREKITSVEEMLHIAAS